MCTVEAAYKTTGYKNAPHMRTEISGVKRERSKPIDYKNIFHQKLHHLTGKKLIILTSSNMSKMSLDKRIEGKSIIFFHWQGTMTS